MTVSLKDFYIERQLLCTSSSAKVSDTQGYEKRRKSDDCAESVKMIQKFEKTDYFDVQSGRVSKRTHSTVVEEVATAMYKQSSNGVNLCSAQKTEHWPEHWIGF